MLGDRHPRPARRRRFVVGVIALSSFALLPACGGDDATKTTTPVDASLPPDDAAPDVATSGGYGPATVDFSIDDRTLPIVAPLVDGVYYAASATSDGSVVSFSLAQRFLCDGSGVPDHPEVVCASGEGILEEPSTVVTMSPSAAVTVATGDLNDPTVADVTAEEYARLVSGVAPSSDAPDGYEFHDFLTLVEVADGAVVGVRQYYSS